MRASPAPRELPVEVRLREFETCLETPLVPGDLERWTEALRSSSRRLAPEFRERFERDQPEMCAQIAADEPDLLERVDELRRHNQEVLDRFGTLVRWIEDLSRRVAQVEPDEKRLDEELERLIFEGLAFVIEARKQEVAVRTWMVEAYERETGPVD